MDVFSLDETLNAQVNIRFRSAYLFFSMSVDAERKGYKGVADWFYAQHSKEMRTARRLMNHIDSLGAQVFLYQINEVPAQWDSLLSMFNDKLEHDEKVSELLFYAHTVAEETNKYGSIGFIESLQQEQERELETSQELLELFEAANGDKYALESIDKELSEKA